MTEDRPFTLVIGGDASVKSAQDIAAALKQAIDAHPIVQVDTQTLSAADITTVQTLLAGRTKAEAEGRSLIMLAPLGAPLRQVLEAAGFLGAQAGQDLGQNFWDAHTLQTSGNSPS